MLHGPQKWPCPRLREGEICIQPSLVFGKTVQLSKGRGSEKRNWKRGWMGGKKPAHGSRRIVKGREVATVSPLFTGSSGY